MWRCLATSRFSSWLLLFLFRCFSFCYFDIFNDANKCCDGRILPSKFTSWMSVDVVNRPNLSSHSAYPAGYHRPSAPPNHHVVTGGYSCTAGFVQPGKFGLGTIRVRCQPFVMLLYDDWMSSMEIFPRRNLGFHVWRCHVRGIVSEAYVQGYFLLILLFFCSLHDAIWNGTTIISFKPTVK